MSKPTIRELLTGLDITDYKVELLAERVEAVLKLAEKRHAAEAYDAALRNVVRVLNGEQQ